MEKKATSFGDGQGTGAWQLVDDGMWGFRLQVYVPLAEMDEVPTGDRNRLSIPTGSLACMS